MRYSKIVLSCCGIYICKSTVLKPDGHEPPLADRDRHRGRDEDRVEWELEIAIDTGIDKEIRMETQIERNREIWYVLR